jgi:enoyl-CoA hydratase
VKASSREPAEKRLRVERDGDVAVWTIDRPEVRNAFDLATIEALAGAIRQASRDRSLRAVVLTGAGSIFASGGDLRELRTLKSRRDAGRLFAQGRALCDGIARLHVPVVAALPGPAIGGGAELAMACDLRVADPRAKLSFRHARMGVTTAWGRVGKLVALAGHAAASRLLLLGHDLDAQEALRLGLVDAVTEEGACVATALSWARDAGKGAPAAVAGLKALLRGVTENSPARQLAQERASFVATWTGTDHDEAVEAFFEGRAPVWGKRP